jgi:hypothetical protein
VHRWPHTHVHLTEVDKDRYQRDGVPRQVVDLKTVILQESMKKKEENGSLSPARA